MSATDTSERRQRIVMALGIATVVLFSANLLAMVARHFWPDLREMALFKSEAQVDVFVPEAEETVVHQYRIRSHVDFDHRHNRDGNKSRTIIIHKPHAKGSFVVGSKGENLAFYGFSNNLKSNKELIERKIAYSKLLQDQARASMQDASEQSLERAMRDLELKLRDLEVKTRSGGTANLFVSPGFKSDGSGTKVYTFTESDGELTVDLDFDGEFDFETDFNFEFDTKDLTKNQAEVNRAIEEARDRAQEYHRVIQTYHKKAKENQK